MALKYHFKLAFGILTILLVFASKSTLSEQIEKSSTETSKNMALSSKTQQLYACSFEVFGKVQGVYFRKYTEKQANILGVHGWCMNTEEGTVKGHLEAPLPQINEMKVWLQQNGSPKSIIKKTEFTPSRQIEAYSFQQFTIRR